MQKVIDTKDAPAAIGPYSQAVEQNGVLFISGQLPINPRSGNIEAKDIKGQANQVFENIEAILTEAGYNVSDITKTTCMLTDLNNFTVFNEYYARFLGDHKPARSTFQVSALPLNAMVEVETIAMKE